MIKSRSSLLIRRMKGWLQLFRVCICKPLSVSVFLRLPSNFFLGNQASGGVWQEVLFPSQAFFIQVLSVFFFLMIMRGYLKTTFQTWHTCVKHALSSQMSRSWIGGIVYLDRGNSYRFVFFLVFSSNLTRFCYVPVLVGVFFPS